MALTELCGLWIGRTRDGREYFSGKLEDGRKVFIFTNDHKQEDRHPDYRLMVDDGTGPPPRDDQPRQRSSSPAARQRQAEQQRSKPPQHGESVGTYERRREQMKSFTPPGDDAPDDLPF